MTDSRQIVLHPLTERLKNLDGQLRGKEWRDVYYLVRSYVALDLADRAREIREKTGKLTARDIFLLAIEFNLIPKHAFDFLAYQGVISEITYQRLRDQGLKPNKFLEEIKQELEYKELMQ
ncbi:hypothetical protein V0288_11195 [Pannus brasiliensis CCIBt3594]|uniref:Uncharacterized protein n=1 Tax=Pannus brasiliensis CCIBt3594 TaxID=1427578 RepID=A0AAW9QIR3_9CHRO